MKPLSRTHHEPAPGFSRRPLVSGPVALPMSARTVLVALDTVRAALGMDAENVMARVESGKLQWVFDLSLSTSRRELRFWLLEVAAPAQTAGMTLPEVLAAASGGAASVARGELERRWLVSHVTIGRWIKHAHIQLAAPGFVSRTSLETFLADRWLGAQGQKEAKTP